MKRLIYSLALIAILMSCKKDNPKDFLKKHIVGTWTISEARMNVSDDWHLVLDNEPQVCVSENHLSDPWNKDYIVINGHYIQIESGTNGIMQLVHIEFENDECMLWTFSDGSQMRLCE